jgi:hypothetical protein
LKLSVAGRPTATVKKTDLLLVGIMDEPKGIAADACHVGINHRQNGACCNRSIDYRAPCPQDINTSR